MPQADYLNILVSLSGKQDYPSSFHTILNDENLKTELNWNFQMLENCNSEEMHDKVKKNKIAREENNIILLFADDINVVKSLINNFEEISFYPDLILASDKEFESTTFPEDYQEHITITNTKINSMLLVLTKAYAYNNDLGDIFEAPLKVKLLDFLRLEPDSPRLCLLKNKKLYDTYLNFVFISKFSAEKNELINILIGERKAIEGKTKKFQKYYHNSLPLCFINTPDIIRDEDYENIRKYISQNRKIHAVFYPLNSQTRNPVKEHSQLINEIRSRRIPFFVPLTKCVLKKAAARYKDELEINFQQEFGFDCDDILSHIEILNLTESQSKSIPRYTGLGNLIDIVIKCFNDEKKKSLQDKGSHSDKTESLLPKTRRKPPETSSNRFFFPVTWLFMGSFLPYLTNYIDYYFPVSVVNTSVVAVTMLYLMKDKIKQRIKSIVKFISFLGLALVGNYYMSEEFMNNIKSENAKKISFGIISGSISGILGYFALRSLWENDKVNEETFEYTEEKIEYTEEEKKIIDQLPKLKESLKNLIKDYK